MSSGDWQSSNNIGALISRVGFWGISYYTYNKLIPIKCFLPDAWPRLSTSFLTSGFRDGRDKKTGGLTRICQESGRGCVQGEKVGSSEVDTFPLG